MTLAVILQKGSRKSPMVVRTKSIRSSTRFESATIGLQVSGQGLKRQRNADKQSHFFVREKSHSQPNILIQRTVL